MALEARNNFTSENKDISKNGSGPGPTDTDNLQDGQAETRYTNATSESIVVTRPDTESSPRSGLRRQREIIEELRAEYNACRPENSVGQDADGLQSSGHTAPGHVQAATAPPVAQEVCTANRSPLLRVKDWIGLNTTYRIKRSIVRVLTRCLTAPPPDLRASLQAAFIRTLDDPERAEIRIDQQLALAKLLDNPPAETRARLHASLCNILELPTLSSHSTEGGPIPPPPSYSEQRAVGVYGQAFRRCFEYVSGTGIQGPVLEFGTFYGWTACLLADLMRRFDHRGDLWLFDSFSGFPEFTSHVDEESYEARENQVWRAREMSVPQGHERRLAETLSSIIGPDRLKIIKGMFEETLDSSLTHDKAALVHVDCDLYASSKFVLSNLLEKHAFSDGCVLLLDDYNTNRANPSMGERRALTEEFSAQDRYMYSEWFAYGWHGMAFMVHDRNSFLK